MKVDSSPFNEIRGKLFVLRKDMDFDWEPSDNAVLKLLFSLRLSAALWSNISDCDEVYNYWEPLHLFLFGKGFQTWEYSPVYAIRSYFYIYLHYIPANLLYHLLPYSKIALFITLRCCIGIFTLLAEFSLYKAVCKHLSISIGRFFVVFSMLSTGMFISSTAFLPSSFAMTMNMYAMAAFLNEKWFYAIFCTAVSTIVGWPFAAVLGLPIVVDMAPLNIVLYNVFSEHGPDLYGVEPLMYYVKNLALNWNIAAVLVPFAVPLSAFNYLYSWQISEEHKKWRMHGEWNCHLAIHPSYWRHYSSVFLLFASLSAWCIIFFSRPHKEERFLFPIYPLIALLAAISLDSAERYVLSPVWFFCLQRLDCPFSNIIFANWLAVLFFMLASMSRTFALHKNFSAHIEVYKSLNEHLMDHQRELDFSKRGDLERASTMDAQASVEVMSPEKIKCVVKDVMQRAAVLVKVANDLPRRGDDFELCNSFSTFTAFMEQQETRIRLMLTSLMRNAGCPTRMPKMNSDVDEYLERIVMVDDHVVERAGIVMDELDRGGREDVEIPKTVIGAESVKKRKAEAESMFQEQVHTSDPGSVLAERLRLTQQEAKYAKVEDLCEKPQKKYGFESSIDNSYNIFIPKLLNKHHALPRKKTSGMVIIDEDMGSDESKRICLQDFLDISKTPLTMVETVEDLRRLRDVLNSCVEFAVDLEHHDFRSYLGLTCLIQISTRTEDYIIDPFPIWNEMHILNEPFTDPKILKVFHGAEHDIEWLQRDFGIYVVNMFDTGRAMRQLKMQKFNLRYLVHHYCGISLNKKYQLSDWRVRQVPLDSDMITYARSDTHYLLYCCDRLREDLLGNGDSNRTLLRLVYSGSASICSRVYQKPSFDTDGFHGLERRFVNNRQETAMQVLWHWRDRMAREEDESVQYILPNHMLIRIAESLPRELQGILHCCNPVPPLVRELILKCRDLPLIEYKNEVMDEVTEELLRRRRMLGKYTKENIFIICPLDFSQTGFDEESGNQMCSSKVDDTSVIERNPTNTLLSVLDSANVIGNNLTGDCGAYTVVDKVSHFLIVDINNRTRVAQWSEAPSDTQVESFPTPMARQAFHPSGVGKLVPDLSGKIAALARYIGRPPRAIVKARCAFIH
ncbi:unnamed protein product [Angiostrongylus costaricensis]|uniref:HRDC domain-containing protein n=1 Tax=Angiostrongylus costaricensis TaxID=334426 RepID=A0A158PGR4_ANGCS|nr:unnamed protein product [Angiostrongylus costaricensis]